MVVGLLWLGCASGNIEGDDANECRDGADNDQDGLFDCDDGGCAGSPDCGGVLQPIDTSDPGTLPIDTGSETDPPTDPLDDEMGSFCAGPTVDNGVTAAFMTLTLTFDVDTIFEGPIFADCVATYQGNAGNPQTEGRCLTMAGTWTLFEHNCPSGLINDEQQIVWYDTAAGESFHTWQFDDTGNVLQAWVTHGERRHGAPADAFGDQFWVTEIDDDIERDDAASYTESARLRDGLLEFATLEQQLEVALVR
ncbi:MAG: hypothetical protein AAF602_13770 [Myxococcota bacterium]